MLVPFPPFILDVLMSISITIALMILLISIYVREPLEFSTFPTLLLLTTVFRLALNVATSPLHPPQRRDGRGEPRRAWRSGPSSSAATTPSAWSSSPSWWSSNFVVITKGASRVAEVSARFTLDAMPGKQMAIDAELSNQLIDREEARRRRSKVEREADFHGAMDGSPPSSSEATRSPR